MRERSSLTALALLALVVTACCDKPKQQKTIIIVPQEEVEEPKKEGEDGIRDGGSEENRGSGLPVEDNFPPVDVSGGGEGPRVVGGDEAPRH